MRQTHSGPGPLPLIRFFLHRHWPLAARILVAYIFLSMLEALAVIAIYPLVHSVLPGSVPAVTGGPLASALSLVQRLSPNSVLGSASLVVLMQIATALLFLCHRGMTGDLFGRINRDSKRAIVERLGQSSLERLSGLKTGELLYLADGAPWKAASMTVLFLELVVLALRFFAIVLSLFFVDPGITAVLLVIGGVFFVVNGRLSRRVSLGGGEARARISKEASGILQEFLTGTRHIRVYGVSAGWQRRLDDLHRRYGHLYARELRWSAFSQRAFELFGMAGSCLILVVLALAGESVVRESLPVISMFVFALSKLVPTVATFGSSRMLMSSFIPEAAQVRDFIEQEPVRWQDGACDLSAFTRSVRFEGVGFSHPGRPPLFSGLDLEFVRGQTTVIVGPSGAGKTTILNLLCGLLAPHDGRILIDGTDLRRFRRADWLKRIGLVSQDSFILNANIHENIVFGRSGYSDDDVARAARRACADEFIRELPEGYATAVGERGLKLSGGQLQRICIARALLADPEILVLDEATNSLDAFAEDAVQEVLGKSKGELTVVWVTHRLSIKRFADKVYQVGEKLGVNRDPIHENVQTLG